MEPSARVKLPSGRAAAWFRRGRLLIVSPDSMGTACPLSGRNSTYPSVQISETRSYIFRIRSNAARWGQSTAYDGDTILDGILRRSRSAWPAAFVTTREITPRKTQILFPDRPLLWIRRRAQHYAGKIHSSPNGFLLKLQRHQRAISALNSRCEATAGNPVL